MFACLLTTQCRSLSGSQSDGQTQQSGNIVFSQIRATDSTALIAYTVTGTAFTFTKENRFTCFRTHAFGYSGGNSASGDICHNLPYVNKRSQNSNYENDYW